MVELRESVANLPLFYICLKNIDMLIKQDFISDWWITTITKDKPLSKINGASASVKPHKCFFFWFLNNTESSEGIYLNTHIHTHKHTYTQFSHIAQKNLLIYKILISKHFKTFNLSIIYVRIQHHKNIFHHKRLWYIK